MRRVLLAVLLAAALARGRAFATDPGAGTSGANFLRLGQGSARAMAMGQASVALSEGADALLYNPAGLAAAQQRELAYSYLRYIQDVDSPIYLGYAHPLGRTAWGANFAYLTVDGFDVRDAQGVPQASDSVSVRDGFGSVAVARSFLYEKLFLGAALRMIHEDVAGAYSDTAAGDAGMIFRPNASLSLAAALQNFGANPSKAPRTTRAGASARVSDFITIAAELSKASDRGTRIGLGGEFQLPEEYLDVGQVALRLGYQNSDRLGQSYDQTLQSLRLDRAAGLSFGFGVYTSQAFGYGLALDYAFVPYGALGTVDQITMKLKF